MWRGFSPECRKIRLWQVSLPWDGLSPLSPNFVHLLTDLLEMISIPMPIFSRSRIDLELWILYRSRIIFEVGKFLGFQLRRERVAMWYLHKWGLFHFSEVNVKKLFHHNFSKLMEIQRFWVILCDVIHIYMLGISVYTKLKTRMNI